MSDKKKILIIQNVHEAGLKLLKNNSNYEFEIIKNLDLKILKKKIANCDGLAIKTSKLPYEVIKAAKNLKIISRYGVGYDNIDLKAAKENNITIAITANANAVTVAEHVFFMLLSIIKRKNMLDNAVRTGKFKDKNKLPSTMELWKKNILIAGFGRIGKSLIKRCLGFEMNVFVYDPFVSKNLVKSYGGKKVENLKVAVKKMDMISLHMPFSKKTKNLFNMKLLKKMKPNCVLVNAARGGIINERDLDVALKQNLIFGAGLDVFSIEPPKNNNPLLKNDKVFLSPHVAASTEECKKRMGIEAIQNIIDFFDKKLGKSKIIKFK